MPELPDIQLYIEHLDQRVTGTVLEKIRFASPFLLRTVTPPISELYGKKVTHLSRIGKRIVFAFPDDLYLVIHLMIAGRIRWKEKGAKVPGKVGLAALDFERGTLIFTEASSKKRASVHVVRGAEGLKAHDRGGLEVIGSKLKDFARALKSENHTIKRTLTDPRIFSGIGNAYSDEILFRARMSPMKQTKHFDDDEIALLHRVTQEVLEAWIVKLREETGEDFPDKVTAFREDFAVHGRFKQPCPDCGSPVQRIAYAENETNYCANCQTGGKLLADRSLSRLLKDDWPKTLEELE